MTTILTMPSGYNSPNRKQLSLLLVQGGEPDGHVGAASPGSSPRPQTSPALTVQRSAWGQINAITPRADRVGMESVVATTDIFGQVTATDNSCNLTYVR